MIPNGTRVDLWDDGKVVYTNAVVAGFIEHTGNYRVITEHGVRLTWYKGAVVPVSDRKAYRYLDKATPITTGLLDYFPAALAAVARVSKAGNDKHNAGEPLHWARDKSLDHVNSAGRHLLQRGTIDPETGEDHLASAVWRLLAELQLIEEAKGAPLAITPRARPQARPEGETASEALRRMAGLGDTDVPKVG